tara:strand:- start:48 stop:194 length:147 start_codon:yes stop_codon:yes gene_type:complete
MNKKNITNSFLKILIKLIRENNFLNLSLLIQQTYNNWELIIKFKSAKI